jgi:hypothetical protein
VEIALGFEIGIIDGPKWTKRVVEIVVELSFQFCHIPGRIHVEMGMRKENRDKISNSLNMIPMKMGKKEMIAPGFIRERITVTPYSKACVKQQRIVPIFYFNTCGMRTKHNLIAFRGTNLPTSSPKDNADGFRCVVSVLHNV